ncbi:non-specific phospholipase C6-like [Impatiens glandulifera]|uniref:non-specific phospholipase C6-like n=1 Tax=Impatiens glandulifera TaxID=253017 RepID=UPI001FB0540A|nr:non-specific phospholipase C6-like [Impatiens glandulifera]
MGSRPFSFIFLLFLAITINAETSEKVNEKKQPIKTIVVLILENRSFDHILGWMKRSVNPSINGVTGRECNPVSTKSKSSKSICVTDNAEYVDPDPGHSFEAVKQQVFGSKSRSTPSMSGFIEQAISMSQNISNSVMKGFKPESVPVFAELVRQFAVFDRWFSSIPGPTQPNRLFAYSASSFGSTTHDVKQLSLGYPQKTIFDSMYENGKDFGIYYENVPATLFYKNLRSLKYALKFHLYRLKFKKDAANGKLPSLTVIEPRYFDLVGLPANDDHPSHDVANGQKLVKEVYETLRSSPQWNETLFVITYDEHGGFFDHVQTPFKNVPNPDGKTSPAPDSFKFDRLGVRVPTIMVSPWIKKGIVVSKAQGPTSSSEYEHSSIPATIKKIFNLSSDFLNRRDAWAGTFEHVIGELNSPRTDCPERLPEPPALRKSEPDEDREVSEFQAELIDVASFIRDDNDDLGKKNKKMTVREGEKYVRDAMSSFIRASKEALRKLGSTNTCSSQT